MSSKKCIILSSSQKNSSNNALEQKRGSMKKRKRMTLEEFIKELARLPGKGWKVKKFGWTIRFRPPKNLCKLMALFWPMEDRRSFCDCPITAVNRQRSLDQGGEQAEMLASTQPREVAFGIAAKRLCLDKSLAGAIADGADLELRYLVRLFEINDDPIELRFRVLALRKLGLRMDRVSRSALPRPIRKLLKVS